MEESQPLSIELTHVEELQLARRLTDRKFMLAVGGLLIATLMLLFSKISGGEYVTLCSLIYTGFITANVFEKRA